MQDEELNPCPFCGPNGKVRVDDWATWYVKCDECGAQQIGLTREAAITAWNTRTPHPLADEMLGVREALSFVREAGDAVFPLINQGEDRIWRPCSRAADRLDKVDAILRTLIAKVEAGEGVSGLCATCGNGPGFHAHAPFNEEWHEFTPPASPQSEKGL